MATRTRTKLHPYFRTKEEGKLEISKIEAAERQLETAITLWFEDGDPISVSTLAHAAWTIVRFKNLTRKAPTCLLSENLNIPGLSAEEANRMAQQIYSGPANFSKHANLSAEETIFFNPLMTELIMFDAVFIYNQWEDAKKIPAFVVYTSWLRSCEVNTFPENKFEAADRLAAFEIISSVKKRAFFRSHMPIANRLFGRHKPTLTSAPYDFLFHLTKLIHRRKRN